MSHRVGLVTWIAGVCALLPTIACAQVSTGFNSGRVFFGGSVGASFGDATYLSLSPLIGYRVNDRLSVGGSLIYRYRSDDRFGRDLSTNDYGASVFARYTVVGPFFVQGELEQLSYEYIRPDLTTARTDATSFFAGGGVSHALSRNVNLYATALYNFSYGSQSPSPYSSPWVLRFGVGVGF